jgi:hypothetical protein
LGLAVADRHQVARADAIFFEEEPLDRLGAAFGQPLIVCVAAFGVSMPGKNESVALQFGARQSLAKSGNLRNSLRADMVRIVVEVHFEIDARPLLGDRCDLLALGGRQGRTSLPPHYGLHRRGMW